MYNYIIGDLGRILNSPRVDEKVEVIMSFARIGIKHDEVLDKFVSRIF